MNIADRIEEAAIKAHTETGKRPTEIYLGMREHGQLRSLIRDTVRVQQVAGYPPRDKFMGMDVFRVDASDHLAVSA